MADLVTGEAVVLDLQLAKVPTRALAFAIDLAVMSALFVALAFVVGELAELLDPALAFVLILGLLLGVFVGYPVICETLTRGRTLGKLALGLRVVREDGGPIRFRHAFARGLAGLIVDFGLFSLFTGVIALISSLASPNGRRVGDMLAGTVVLRERAPGRPAPPVPMPPALASWASGLELSGLPDHLAHSARQFLQRAGELDPGVRTAMGHDLATSFGVHVSPPPPPGTPGEPYLAVVLAERRRREAIRLAAVQARRVATLRRRSRHPVLSPAVTTAAPHRVSPGHGTAPAPVDVGGFAAPR